MKKFIFKISIFCLIIIGLFIVLIIFIPINKQVYLYAQKNKLERLDTLSSPKLVFIGGSNLALGINSKTISDSLEINVQNMGLHAAIGLRFMIDQVIPHIKNNDIVVIMPEYQQFYNNYNGTAEALTSSIIFSGKEYYKFLNFSQIEVFFSGLSNHIKSKLFFHKNDDWTYSSDNFNIYGDEEEHWKFKHPLSFSKPTLINGNIDIKAIEDLKTKIYSMEEKGAKVYLFWPITIQSYYNFNKSKIIDLDNTLNRYDLKPSMPMDYFVVEDTLQCDTHYHMNGRGVDEITNRMIKILKQKM